MSILATIGRIVRKAFGYRYLEIAEDLPGRVTLRYGHTMTTFDRKTGKVEQNGSPVAMVSLVEKIELHQPLNHEGPPNWYVTVHISGHRQLEVGQSTDELDASIVAARISKITERPVVVNASGASIGVVGDGKHRCCLTPPSRGRPQAGFAHLRPPLTSNVRHQKAGAYW